MSPAPLTWVRDHLFLLLFALATVCLSVGSGLVTSLPSVGAIMILAAGVLGLVSNQFRERREEDRETLAKRLRGATALLEDGHQVFEDARNVAIDSLEQWVQAIAISARLDASSRISVYVLVDSIWMRRARYSQNLKYMQSGRLRIPAGEGVIDTAHDTGEYAVDGLPAFDVSPEEYFGEQKKLRINKGVCRELTMRSRSYALFAFGREGGRGRPFVLVFESTDPKGLDAEQLGSVVHDEMRRALAKAVDLIAMVERD